ncbi:MAG: molybdopterin oxidoreductase, partial [Deltaproteobacteria bacterium]|nr:molybdopterin oxidoreductase [Deltaproteobacteria bacterium]
GKIEFQSETLKGMGLSSMPTYHEVTESPIGSPDLAKEYPLVLSTGIRSPVFFHTQYRQIPRLREIHPDPLVRMHPETAQNLNISEGDWVYIETPRGRCRQKAKLTLGIDPRVVMAEHDWWFPEAPAEAPGLHGAFESNINVLTSSEPPYDPGFGSTPNRSLLCKIYRAEEITW